MRTASAADGGYFLWWPTRTVGHNVQEDCALRPSPGPNGPTWDQIPAAAADAGESAADYNAKCHAAIELSFEAWQDADGGCTDLRLPDLGDTPTREVGYAQGGSQNMNLVLFQPALCDDVIAAGDPCWNDGDCDTAYPANPCFSHGAEVIALTTTTYQPADGTLLDADIELNNAPASAGGFDFSAEQPGLPLAGTTDIENTVTHEAGHFIGLAHNCGTQAGPVCTVALEQDVMYAVAVPGEITKRTLKQDDIDAVCHVYPKGVSTEFVNLRDELGGFPVQVTGGFGTSCGAAGEAPAWLALLALAALARRRR
ncbi:MAG: zinc metalloprotease [Myxococcales bacterium]